MSLEIAIQENTAALRELIAAISKGLPVAASTVAEVAAKSAEVTAKTEKAAEVKKPAAQTASSQPGAQPQSEGQKAAAQESPAAADVTYDDVKAAVIELSKEKGREMTVALLSRHGVAKAPDLQPEQYAAVVGDVKKVLAGELNPEAAEIA